MVEILRKTRGKITVPSKKTPSVAAMVEGIVGCKWSLYVLSQIRAGVNRPGALARSADGLSTKVLNERLSKMVRLGILDKAVHPEVPPRVEYHLTRLGRRFIGILDKVEELQGDLEQDEMIPE